MNASVELEAFIDESIKRSIKEKYHPTVFQGMRKNYGTLKAIKKLIVSGEVQSGFVKLKALDLLDWSIEAAVMRFPNEFTADEIACAKFRLEMAEKGEILR